jgi:hypothetical protein
MNPWENRFFIENKICDASYYWMINVCGVENQEQAGEVIHKNNIVSEAGYVECRSRSRGI